MSTCQRGGCDKLAIESCTATTLDGNECVNLTCADHRCPCTEGVKRPVGEDA